MEVQVKIIQIIIDVLLVKHKMNPFWS